MWADWADSQRRAWQAYADHGAPFAHLGAAAGTELPGRFAAAVADSFESLAAAVLRIASADPGDGADIGPALADAIERMVAGSGPAKDLPLAAFFGHSPLHHVWPLAPGMGGDGDIDTGARYLESLRGLVGWPPLGPGRAWLNELNALQQTTLDLRVAQGRLVAHYEHALKDGLAGFVRFLRNDEGEPVVSLAGLYDAWVDVAESAYADIVMTDEFSRDFGDYVNRVSALKHCLKTLSDRFAVALDFPQRRDIDALVAMQRQLEAEIACLAAELAQARPANDAPPARMTPTGAAKKAVQGAVEKTATAAAGARRPTGAAKRKSGVGEFDIDSISGK